MSQSFIPEYKIHDLYFFKHLNCIFTIYVHHPKYRIPRIDFFLIMAHSILITFTKLDVPISFSVNAKIAGTIHIYLSIRSLLVTSVGCGDHRESTVYYVEGPLPVKSRLCGCSYLISFQSGISHITPVASQLAMQSFSPM